MKKEKILLTTYIISLVISAITLIILNLLNKSGNYDGFLQMLGIWVAINIFTCLGFTFVTRYIEHTIKPTTDDNLITRFAFLAYLPVLASFQIIISTFIMSNKNDYFSIFHIVNFIILILELGLIYFFNKKVLSSKPWYYLKYSLFVLFWFAQIEFAIA